MTFIHVIFLTLHIVRHTYPTSLHKSRKGKCYYNK